VRPRGADHPPAIFRRFGYPPSSAPYCDRGPWGKTRNTRALECADALEELEFGAGQEMREPFPAEADLRGRLARACLEEGVFL